MEYLFKAELWEYPGQGAWFFLTLPKDYTGEIKTISEPYKKGFGSVKVQANIGKTSWTTSIFPDSKSGSYLLPVKKDVRKSESLSAGDFVSVKVEIIT